MIQLISARVMSLGVVFLIMMQTQTANALPTNEYLLKWTPRKLATCQEDAVLVAKKFAANNVKVLSSSCVKDFGLVSEISIFLEKDSVPAIYSALFAYQVGAPLNSIYRSTPLNQRYDLNHAQYVKTLDECLSRTPEYEQMFQHQTGLEPLATQCIKVGRGAGYAIQIDGLGEPKLKLNRFEQKYIQRFLDDASLNKISARLASNGFNVVDSRWTDGHLFMLGWGEPGLNIMPLYLYESNSFATIDECDSQKAAVLNRIVNLGRSVFQIKCDVTSPRPRLLVLEEVTKGSELSFIDVEKIGRFGKMEECMAMLLGSTDSEEFFCSLDVNFVGDVQGYRLNRIFAHEKIGAGTTNID
jgi:hypothetical protein